MNTEPLMDLYDYGVLLKRYLAFIVLFTLLGTGAAVITVFFLIKPTYEATASLLLLPQAQQQGAGALLAQLESQMELMAPLRGMLGSPPLFSSSATDMVSILRSRAMAEKVSGKIPLKTLPEVQKILVEVSPQQEKVKLVTYLRSKVLVFPPDSRDSTLRVAVRLPDQHLPAQVANAYIKELDGYIQRLLNTNTLESQNFINRQLQQAEAQLQQAEEELLRFQKQHRTVSLTDEIKQYIKYLTDLEAEELAAQSALREAQTKLNAVSKRAHELSPTWSDMLSQLEMNKAGLAYRKTEIEKTRRKYERLVAVLPIQALNLARLERRVNLHNRMFVFLNQQQQALKMEASRSIHLFKILDTAIEPEKPIAPVKKVVVGGTALLSLGLAFLLAMLHYHWQRSRQRRQQIAVA